MDSEDLSMAAVELAMHVSGGRKEPEEPDGDRPQWMLTFVGALVRMRQSYCPL